MAQEIADSTLLDTWGSGGNIVEPDISKIIEGWQLGEQPPHEYMNWLQNTFGSKLNHILKNGVASWNNETQYLAGSSVQRNGNVWLCKATNTNSAPTDANANWKRIITVESLTTVLNGYVATTGNQTIAGTKTFSSTISGSISGNSATATKLATARKISLTGDVTGDVNFDGSANVSITAVVEDDSHNHVISNVDGLQDALDSKADKSDTYTKTEVLGSFGNLSSPLLDLPLQNSLSMKAGVGSATFTRASTATYIDRYGALKTAGINEPRFEKEGYLNEGSSTNLILNSETLTNQSVTVISGTTYTISFYGTGVVTLGGAFSSSINGLGLFPTRTKLTFVATSTILTISVSGEAKLSQLEALSFATSYIPTTTSTVTRSADVLQVTRENNFPNAENNEEGYSVAYTYDSLGTHSANQFLWSLRGNIPNFVGSYLNFSGNSLRNAISKEGATMFNSVLPVKPLGSNRVVQTQSNTFLKQYINGTLADTDVNTLGTLGGGVNSLTNITIGGSTATEANLFGHISDFKVYDRELTPVEVSLL